ncbi:MAG TPA: sigma-70 family RNA polymerase sigma factor [Coriobacteriia bacterium]|jgi:RNA polymerase sigma factor (sigma-70 family)
MSDDSAPFARGDFDRIYRAERLAVHRHLVFITGDRALADDLTQETFGKLYDRPPAEPLRNARAWLLTVASNLACNHLRGETRRRDRETRADSAPAADVDDVLDVRRALAALDPRDGVMLLLRHSGFSYAEIAEAVGLAPASVGTVLARAQRRFREAYEGPGVRE